MRAAPLPHNEDQRLRELLYYEILDSEDEGVFDELTELASAICGTQISLISLVDSKRQWFKSRVGLDARETPRELAFCAHAIHDSRIFEVNNALEDERFADNPLVTSDPNIRFYAGAPLETKEGIRIGTLCVIDPRPMTLSSDQRRALEILSNQVVTQLNLRIQKRRLERMNAEREKFYAMLAHDIRSPFNGILGLSRLLKDSAEHLDPQQTRLLAGELLTSSLDLYQLIDEILQWTQNRMTQGEAQIAAVSLSKSFQASLGILRETISQKQIALENTIDPQLYVEADVTLLKTVMRNLLANAIKYSSEGKSIRVSARSEKGRVIMRVEDDGLGVPDEVRKHLFKRGVASQTGTAGELGHGLGLSLAYDFMHMQGGDMWLDDEYRNGAAFEVSLPQADPKAN
ncbi:MAG: GAF domain-containing sensor histidine kinase [Oleiphilaceae bacterium]|nr:GAF domain-containing sensor histidine kinase [Oleiphilaceae bacterium]